MVDTLPDVRVRTGMQSQEGFSEEDALARPSMSESSHRKVDPIEYSEARPKSKVYPSRFIPSLSGVQANASSKLGNTEEKRESKGIDPLSHHILKRTNTPIHLPKMRTSAPSEEDSGKPEVSPVVASGRTSSDTVFGRSESVVPGAKDKRNRASFFSRFAPKKKDTLPDINDNDSEAGDRRTEGMDAEIFSQPIGYIPQFPSPPKYIKVRSHGKKDKDFNRVFLAQELRGRTGVEIAQSGGRLVKNGAYKHGDKEGNAIWAMEFSKDGKHLAAGGKDYVVRVWQVISAKEDRLAHETEESRPGKESESVRLSAPVFKTKTVREYGGHEASILDLSWSKNNFLISSSMDKTVRLWHLSRQECLCVFKHSDFVTSIQFHPRDDRFFLAGSLDSKLRLWSIPDKSVAYSNQVQDLITAVTFTPDGKTAIAGCLSGLCIFYDTDGLKYQTQLHVRSAHGKNAKGSKITGIQAINYPPDQPNAEVKLLITSNDSRVRVYNLRDKGLELKLKGNENSCSQIHATFSDNAQYIICGSEDRKAYIWSTGQPETEREKRPMEMFEAHSAIVTTAIMAPTKTRQLLSTSGDPLYDLCNPPPVTLISRSQSQASSLPPIDDGRQPDASFSATPATPNFTNATKPEESPAYLARCTHPDGNIIVTADFQGHIKVFRQDCAYQNRLRNNDSNATFSKKMLGQTNSVNTKRSSRSFRDPLQTGHPSSERILSWRQSIGSNNGSLDNFRLKHQRSSSPHKSIQNAGRHPSRSTTNSTSQQQSPQRSFDDSKNQLAPSPDLSRQDHSTSASTNKPADIAVNPLMLQGEQSYMFWNQSVYQAQASAQSHRDPHKGNGYSQVTSTAGSSSASVDGHPAHLGVPLNRATTTVSRLSSEGQSDASASPQEDGTKEVICRKCGGRSFKARTVGGKPILKCESCGEAV